MEFEVLPLSSSALSVRLALRAGFLFSTGDSMLGETCNVTTELVSPCSRPITQLAIRATLFRIVRLSLAGEWAPSVRPNEADLWTIRPTIGAQLTFD